MTLLEQLQEAADAGHRQKLFDEQVAAAARAAAEAGLLAAQIEAASNILRSLPARMKDAARRGRTVCAVHTVQVTDINLARAMNDGCHLKATSLKGISLIVFDALQGMRLQPSVTLAEPNLYQIEIPVLPPTRGAAA